MPATRLPLGLLAIWVRFGALAGVLAGLTAGIAIGLGGELITAEAGWLRTGLLAGPSVGLVLGAGVAMVGGAVALGRHDTGAEQSVHIAAGRRGVWVGALLAGLAVGLWFEEPMLGIGALVIAVLVGRTIVPVIVSRY